MRMSSFLLQYIEAGGSAREMISDQNSKNINVVVVPMNRTTERSVDLASMSIEIVKNLFFRTFFRIYCNEVQKNVFRLPILMPVF